MKIRDVSAVPLNYKLKTPFKFSGVKLEILEYVLVRIRTEDGVLGFGECPAYWDPRHETQKSTIESINNITEQLVGLSCDDISGRQSAFKKFIPSAYAAQCGLDIACFDVVGKTKELPVAKFFGNPEKVPVEAVIPMTSTAEAVSITMQALEKGIQTFKIKVGRDIEKELLLIKEIKRTIGNYNKIFVDANQAWKNVDEAIKAINRFSEYNLCWIEQPLKSSVKPEQLEALKSKVSVPMMLDESVYTSEDVEQYSKKDSADMFNIKLAKTGGISGAIDFYNEAKKYDKKCMLGSMIEGALGTLAGLHFASVFALETTALNSFILIDDNLAFGPEIIDGYMTIPMGSGLGYGEELLFNDRFSS